MEQSSSTIALASSTAEIEQCYCVMSQLRSHLKVDNFVTQIQAQMASGYRLAYITETEVVGVAGFIVNTSLSWGKYLYLTDLVIAEPKRSQGYGAALFNWLIAYAKQHHCQQFHLDSGVQRATAHKFYFQQGMSIAGYHFSLQL